MGSLICRILWKITCNAREAETDLGGRYEVRLKKSQRVATG